MKFKDIKTTTKFTGGFVLGCFMCGVMAAIGAFGMVQMKNTDAEIQKASTAIVQKYEQSGSKESKTITDLSKKNENLASTLMTVLGFFMIFGVPFGIGVGIGVGSSIRKHSNEMIAAAEEITKGNLDVDIKHVAKDEMGTIGEKLTVMSQTLKLYISDISNHLNYMAQGDMTHEITQDYVGEFLPIKESLERIRNSLSDTMDNINLSAGEVSTMANQVSSSAQMLSQGTTEQASTVEQLSAAIHEVSEKVNSNAAGVNHALSNVKQVEGGVNESNAFMKEMLGAMEEIGSSSNQISQIIKVIDDIAFQTNILALNAAVEAARAGAAGKGFAVVADEVRNLASKSADAAKKTTALIEKSMNSVKGGAKIAKDTADSLQNVSKQTQIVTDTIKEIASASDAQAVSLVEILKGIEQVSGVIQTYSASAEESAATSEQLTDQAKTLHTQVLKFRIGNESVSA